MTTFNTGNPVPSGDARDRFDNTQTLDELVNGLYPSTVSRTGRLIKTFSGMQADFQQIIEGFGFVKAGPYTAGTVLLSHLSYVEVEGQAYVLKSEVPVPYTLTGVWATESVNFKLAGDAVLRSELAVTETGGSLVGYKYPFADTVARTVKSKLDDLYTIQDAGVVGDNVTDDTAALQRMVVHIAKNGGGTIRLAAGKTYYIIGSVILPNFVSIDLNGCTLRGNRGGGSTASMFKTGYFNDSDQLVTNNGAATDLVTLDGVRVFNGRILEAYRGFEFTNANRNCAIESITFTGCVQSWLLTRCWSISLGPCFSDTNSVSSIPTYKFVEAINTINLNQVRAVTDFAFEFSSGSTGSASIVFNNCDVEGSSNRAFYFQGQFYGITWIGGYFEAIPGCVYDFTDVTSATVNWHGTFNYLSGILMREPVGPTATIDGEWDTSNAILGAGQVVGGVTYSATLNIQNPRNLIKFRLPPNFEALTTLPAYVNLGDNPGADVELISNRVGAGLLSRGVATGGILPLHYSGNTGRTSPGQVAFATHVAYAPGSASIVILVRTKIVWQTETTFAKYRFLVTDANGSYTLFGDIYGDKVKPADAVGKAVLVTNNGGFMQVELYGFTHPTGVYTCTGTVQLCT